MTSSATRPPTLPKRSKKTAPSEQVALNIFHDTSWFKDPLISSFWFRVYSCGNIPWKYYAAVMRKAIRALEYRYPIKIYYCILDNLSYPGMISTIVYGESGIPVVHFNADNKLLPKAPYIIFSTPFDIDGNAGNEGETKRRLDIVASVFAMHFGNAYLRELWVEVVVKAHSSEFQVFGNAISLPHPIDGPNLHPLNWTHTEEILNKIQFITKTDQNLVELSLALFERGVRDTTGSKFFYYWVAIEVLCKTNKAAQITKILSRYYQISPKDVESLFYWKEFFTSRHNYFHKGIAPNFTPILERYTQLLFLDLLRCNLGFENLRHLETFVQILGQSPFKGPTPTEIAQAQAPRAALTEPEVKANARKTDRLWRSLIKERKL